MHTGISLKSQQTCRMSGGQGNGLLRTTRSSSKRGEQLGEMKAHNDVEMEMESCAVNPGPREVLLSTKCDKVNNSDVKVEFVAERDYICVDSIDSTTAVTLDDVAIARSIAKADRSNGLRSCVSSNSLRNGHGVSSSRIGSNDTSAAKGQKHTAMRSTSIDNSKSDPITKRQSTRAGKANRGSGKRRRSTHQQSKLTTFFTQASTPPVSRSDSPISDETSTTTKRAKHALNNHATVKADSAHANSSIKREQEGASVSEITENDPGTSRNNESSRLSGLSSAPSETTVVRLPALCQTPTPTDTKHMPPTDNQLAKITDKPRPKSAQKAPNWGCMIDQRRRTQYMASIHNTTPKKGGLTSFFSVKDQPSNSAVSGGSGEDSHRANGPWIPYCKRSYGHRYENHYNDRRPPGVGVYDTDAVRAVRRAGAAYAEPDENEPEPTQISDKVEVEEPVTEPKENYSDVLALNMRRLLTEALKPHFRGILHASQVSDIQRVMGLSQEALGAFVTIFRANTASRWVSLDKLKLRKEECDTLCDAELIRYLGSPVTPSIKSPDYSLALSELSALVTNLSVKQLTHICKLAKVKTTRVDDPNTYAFASWKGGAGVTSNYGLGTNPRKADYVRSVCENAAGMWPFLRKKKSQLPQWVFQLMLDLGLIVRTTKAAESILAAHRLVLAGSSYIPDDAALFLNCGLVWDTIKFLPLTHTPKETETRMETETLKETESANPSMPVLDDVDFSTHVKVEPSSHGDDLPISTHSAELSEDPIDKELKLAVANEQVPIENGTGSTITKVVVKGEAKMSPAQPMCWHEKYHIFQSSDYKSVEDYRQTTDALRNTESTTQETEGKETTVIDTTKNGDTNQCTVHQDIHPQKTYVCVPSSMWTSAAHFERLNEALDLSDELELYTATGQDEPLYSVMHQAADSLMPYTAVDLTVDETTSPAKIQGAHGNGALQITYDINGANREKIVVKRERDGGDTETPAVAYVGQVAGDVMVSDGVRNVRPLPQPYDVAKVSNRPDMRTQHTVDWSRLMCRTVFRGAGLLQKEKKYSEAKHYLDILLRAGGRNPLADREYKKPYPWGTVLLGDIWCRYGRILERLGAIREAIDVYERGLKDQYVVGGQRIAIEKSVAKLSKAPYRWKTPAYESLSFKFTERKLVGERVVVGGRVRFNGSPFMKWPLPLTGGTGGVEEYSRQRIIQILDTPTRKWKGMHAENGVMFTIYGLMMWDVVLEYHAISNEDDSQGHFYTTLQDMPACLYDGILACSGLGKHVAGYLDGLTAVCEGTSACQLSCGHVSLRKILTRAWKRHYGQQCKGVNWVRNSLEEVICIAEGMGVHAVAMCCKRLSNGFEQFAGGLPDLLLWSENDPPMVKYSEVKGPGDKLSERQMSWIDFLQKLGVDVEVCYVEDTLMERAKLKRR